MKRRKLLQDGCVGLLLGLTGCLGDGADDMDPEAPLDSELPDWASEVQFGDVDEEVYVEGRRYVFTPGSNEPITVSAGETIGFAFSSIDDGYNAGHGIGIDAYGVDLRTVVNGVEWTEFTAETAGEFEMYCNVYCSEHHHEMVGTFIVE